MRVEIDPAPFNQTANQFRRVARNGGTDLREVKKVWGLIGRKGRTYAAQYAAILGQQRARGGRAGFVKPSKTSAYQTRTRTYTANGTRNIEVSLRAGSGTAEGKQVSQYAHFPHFGVGPNRKYGRPEWVYTALNRAFKENQPQLKRGYERGIGRRTGIT